MKKKLLTIVLFILFFYASSCQNGIVSKEQIMVYKINQCQNYNSENMDYYVTIDADTVNVICELYRNKHLDEIGLQMNILCNLNDKGPCMRHLLGRKRVNYKIPNYEQLIKIYEVLLDSINMEYGVHKIKYICIPTLNLGKTLLALSNKYEKTKNISNLKTEFAKSTFYLDMNHIMAKYGKKIQSVSFDIMNPISQDYYYRFNPSRELCDSIPTSILHTYITMSVK